MCEALQGTYEGHVFQIHGLVRGMAGRIISLFGASEEFDELEAFGRFVAFEAMLDFDVKRGVKVTTYLFPRLWGGMIRHMHKNGRYVCDETLIPNHRSTEDCHHIGLFETDPYRMSPQEVLEIDEMSKIYDDVSQACGVDLERLAYHGGRHSNANARAQYYRARRKSLQAMQAKVKSYYA